MDRSRRSTQDYSCMWQGWTHFDMLWHTPAVGYTVVARSSICYWTVCCSLANVLQYGLARRQPQSNRFCPQTKWFCPQTKCLAISQRCKPIAFCLYLLKLFEAGQSPIGLPARLLANSLRPKPSRRNRFGTKLNRLHTSGFRSKLLTQAVCTKLTISANGLTNWNHLPTLHTCPHRKFSFAFSVFRFLLYFKNFKTQTFNQKHLTRELAVFSHVAC
jgi:hypothetical protein